MSAAPQAASVAEVFAAIRTAEDRRYAAVLAGNVAELENLFDDHLLYTHSTGSIDGKRSYIAALRRGHLVYQRIDRSDHRLLMRGKTVLVHCRVKMEVSVAGTDKRLDNRTLAVWVAGNGGWRLLAYHSTPLTRGAPAPVVPAQSAKAVPSPRGSRKTGSAAGRKRG